MLLPRTPAAPREVPFTRALPGLLGTLFLCACTLVGSAAVPAGADVVRSQSQTPASAPVPTPVPTPEATVGTPGTGSTRTIPRPRVSDSRPRPAAARALPTRVEVDSVAVSMPAVPVGVAEDGSMELPQDPEVVGWYRFGAAPGDLGGSAVLAAHVDSADQVGPFARLAEIQADSEIVVDTEVGPVSYSVTKVEQLDRARLPVEEIFAPDGPHRLVLITCGGPYERGQGYRDNVVVTAVPQEG